MKKLIFTVFLVFALNSIKGQSIPFAPYNGDTLTYLNENFIRNKQIYINQPLSKLLEKLEFPVKSYIPSHVDAYKAELIDAIYLEFYGRGHSNYLDHSADARSFSIIIVWQTPIETNLKPKLPDPYPEENWTLAIQDFFKDKIVKNVHLYYTNKCAVIRGVRKCEVCDQGSINYNAYDCALSYCDRESANYDSIRCALSICDKSSPLYNEKKCNYSRCDWESPNYNDTICARLICNSIIPDMIIPHPEGQEFYCDSCYCNPASNMYDLDKCLKRNSSVRCDPNSPGYDPLNCIDPSVTNYIQFNAAQDYSRYNNQLALQEGAEIFDNKLSLMGGDYSDYDYMYPHARVANSPSLNTQYITVAVRIRPFELYGCGNDAIVNKPFTSHSAPYYQYHLGICGSYSGSNGYRFGFSCSVNGTNQGVSSSPNIWVPGQWYTVVGTYDGTAIKLFVNGEMVASKVAAGTISEFNTDLFLGKHGNLNYSIPAEIDWVKIYNRAITNAEVSALSAK